MTLISKRAFVRATVTAALAGSSLFAAAQEKPVIKLLVGFPPGGLSDNLARMMAERLREKLGQNVIVENRPGVGGRLAAQAVKAAGPNGNTYIIAPNATFTFQHLTYPVSVLGYDMTTDFTSIGQIISYPMAMVVSSSIGVKSAKDYVAWAKANPGKANYGTAGAGGDTHFNGLQFGKLAGLDMQVVPYRGNAPLVVDILGGQIQTGVMTAGDAIQHIRAGKMVAVGIFANARSPLMADVPTMKEQGFDTGGTDGWMGMWGPAGVPAAEVNRIANALQAVLVSPEVKEQIVNRFVAVAEFREGPIVDRQLRYELSHWDPIIKASGFKPQP
jgi:tripartite-type tricarboxylate transporter receptor subunit TctC